MDRDRFDLLLELVPQDVLTLFFHRKKTAISSQVDEPFTFLKQLQDHDLITEDLCQARKKIPIAFFYFLQKQEIQVA